TIAIFLAYFLGGFLFYSAMLATVGAISSSDQEARQALQPVIFLLMIAYLSIWALSSNPESTYAVTISLIPFTSPIAMPVRWAASIVPASELATSLAMLVFGATLPESPMQVQCHARVVRVEPHSDGVGIAAAITSLSFA